MPHLSICMPSNRPFGTSRRAIETALAYCEAKDAALIVADNSGDAEKRAHWQGRSPRLTYLITDGTDVMTNFMTAFLASDTPFIMPMGDDDEIVFDPKRPTFDLARLPDDHIGVRPVTEVWTEERGVIHTKSFAIGGERPDARIIEYAQAAAGDNSAFYSIFRRKAYIDLMDLFARHHPTKGAYCDWAQVTALFAFGKMQLDRSSVYRYNFAGWHDQKLIDKKNIELFLAADLPADAKKYAPLLQYLDIFIFVSSKQAPLTPDDAINAKAILSGSVFAGFLTMVAQQPQAYSETMRYLAELARSEQDIMGRFQIALIMAGQIREGLKEQYFDYYRTALQYEGVA